MARVSCRFTAVLALVLAAGCQKVNVDWQAKLEPTDVLSKLVSAPSSDQKVVVTAKSPGAPINVYIVLEKDRQAAEEAITNGKKPAGVLAGKEKAEDATLEATIPAKSAYAVVVSTAGGKSASPTIKIAGK